MNRAANVLRPAGRVKKRETDPAIKLARMLLLVYATIYYFIPIALTAVFGQRLDDILVAAPNHWYGAGFALLVIGCVWWACGYARPPSFAWFAPAARLAFNRWVILGAAVLYSTISYWFAREYGLSFRQTGDRISQAGGLVIVLFILQSYMLAVELWLIGLPPERAKVWHLTAALALMAWGSFLSLAASSGVIVLAVAVLLLIRNLTGRDIFRAVSTKATIVTMALLAVLVVAAMFTGIANKRGVDAAAYLFSDDAQTVIDIFQARISYHFYAASFYTNYHFADFSLGFQAVTEVVNAIRHRFDVLVGNPTYFNEIWSVRRLNYEHISFFYRERTGASTGMVAGIYFVPGGILALPLSVLVFGCFFRMLALAAGGRQLSLFGLLFTVMYFTGVADSSIDLLNPFDPAFLKLVFLILVCSLEHSESKKAAAATPAPRPNAHFTRLSPSMARQGAWSGAGGR